MTIGVALDSAISNGGGKLFVMMTCEMPLCKLTLCDRGQDNSILGPKQIVTSRAQFPSLALLASHRPQLTLSNQSKSKKGNEKISESMLNLSSNLKRLDQKSISGRILG